MISSTFETGLRSCQCNCEVGQRQDDLILLENPRDSPTTRTVTNIAQYIIDVYI